MSGRTLSYPFAAVIGFKTAKTALECLLADEDLNGVLLKGPSGTAKSVLARSISSLTDKSIVDLPAGAGDEDIFGGIDFENAVKEGRNVLKGGILQRADGNILCIDNINLMDPRTLNTVMETVMTGKVKIERDGISAEYDCNTTVVATMDPAEHDLPDSILDRFDICVVFMPDADIGTRADIVQQDLEYRSDPEKFCSRFIAYNSSIKKDIDCARQLIPTIKITRRDIHDIVRICNKVNAVGHRGDIACARTARALAALAGSEFIRAEDIREASVMCLQHRRRAETLEKSGGDYSVPGEPEQSDEDEISKKEIAELVKMSKDEESEAEMEAILEGYDPESTAEPSMETVPEVTEEEEVEFDNDSIPDVDVHTSILDEVQTDLAEIDQIEAIHMNKVVGQMPRAIQNGRRNGRVNGYRIPKGRTTDPALGATIRAAAPYQKTRISNGLRVAIEQSDIRENIRTKASTCSFMFALDVSGSLSQTGRLEEAIQAVRSMLEDDYVRRDRVGFLSFGQRLVNLAVPFTRNVEAVFDAMEKTVTGGSTPLGEALLTLNKYMNNYVRKNPDEKCYVIMVTDGEADTAVIPGNVPTAEVKRICATIKIPNTEWIIIDNGSNSRRLNYSQRLAEYLNGRYIEMNDLI